MLIRLKVKGFKNLADIDVRFGPFTCIAGANGVGKSNLFDAITFLSALSSKSLMESARSVRDEQHRTTDVRSLFLEGWRQVRGRAVVRGRNADPGNRPGRPGTDRRSIDYLPAVRLDLALSLR